MKTGLFSVSYAGLWGQQALDVHEFIAKAGELGYEGVLLMGKRPHLSVVGLSDRETGRIRGSLEAAGVQLIGVAAYTDFLIPAPAEVPASEMQELYVAECCRACAALGGSIVRIFTGYDRGGVSTSAQEEQVRASLLRCAEQASAHGVTLALQNHHDLAVDTASMELFLDFVGHPAVRAGYDAWSPHLRGEDLYAGALRMAPRTVMTICADYLTYPRYRYQPELVNYTRVAPDSVKATTMGEGEVDYRSFFRGLREGGFTEWAVYEMCSPLIGGAGVENLDAKAAAFLGFLKGIGPG